MLVTLLGISMLVKPVQCWNAFFPMLVTLFGITMLVKPVHFQNPPLPMLVTGYPPSEEGIVTAPEGFFTHPINVAFPLDTV